MQKSTSIFIGICLCLMCIIELGYGQRELYFQSLSVNDGLSQNNVVAITQDHDGFLWFGTKNGLNCYDGHSFKVFEGNPGQVGALPYARILGLEVDYQDRIWVATEGEGVAYYDKRTELFNTITAQNNESFRGVQIRNLLADDDGRIIWVLSDKGLNKINTTDLSVTFIPLNLLAKEELPLTAGLLKDKYDRLVIGVASGGVLYMYPDGRFTRAHEKLDSRVNGIVEADNGTLWVATEDKGLFIIDKQGLHKPTFHGGIEIATDRLLSMVKDSRGNIWIGSENEGLYVYYKEARKLVNYKTDTENKYSITNNSIHSLYQDILGRVWVGTFNRGVNFWDPYGIKFDIYKHTSQPNSISSNSITVFSKSSQKDKVWVGTDGGGLNLWDRKNNTFTAFKQEDERGITSNAVLALYQNDHNGLWVGTWNGGLMYKKDELDYFLDYEAIGTKNERPIHIFQIAPDEEGNLWLATFDKGLCYYDLKKNVITSYLKSGDDEMITPLSTCLAIDQNKEVWVGSIDGLHRFTPQADGTYKIKLYSQLESLGGDLPNNFIQSLHIDQNDNLWVGTGGGGLCLYDPNTDSFVVYSKKNGFPSDDIFAIEEDMSGRLWLSSSRGLFTFRPSNKNVVVFGVKDGIQDLSFSRNASVKLPSGEMLFGGVAGFNAFTPEKIKMNPVPPRMYFTGLKLFNKSVNIRESKNVLTQPLEYIEQLKLDYTQSVFTINFVGLNLTHPEKNQYAFRLSGLEEDWNYVGNNTSATYTNLDGGTYTFQVKAANNDNLWTSMPKELTIVVNPPWWETSMFRGIAGLFFVIGGVAFYKIRVRVLQKRNEKLERLVDTRTKELIENQNEIEAQNEELLQLSEQMMAQKETLEETLIVVQEKNRQITDSIRYAENIQQAILPSTERIDGLFENYFIVYASKDIVSGDTYWATDREGYTFLSVIDCTGHGVPGAFMSMIGNTLLNKIVKEQKNYNPSTILHKLNEGIRIALQQETSKNTDGMDLAFIRLEKLGGGKYEMKFSGAKNHLYLFRASNDYKYEIIKGSKRSIGAIYNEGAEYKEHTIHLEEGDIFFLSSDGIIDLEVNKGKRFGTTSLMRLAEQHIVNLEDFKQALLDTIDESKETFVLRDDIAVFGVKL